MPHPSHSYFSSQTLLISPLISILPFFSVRPTAVHGFPFESLMTIADQLIITYPPSRLYALEHDEEVRLLMRQRSATFQHRLSDNLSYILCNTMLTTS